VTPVGAPRPVPLAIVGGGAAGLFAAAIAAERGVGALLFERKARPGAKMLMTANGRCNFTKDIPVARMLADIGDPVASFLRPALEALPPAKIAAGFKALGVPVKRMTDGRLFPASEKAADIVHALGDLLRERAAPIVSNCVVTGVRPEKDGFLVSTRTFTVAASNVLIATGGLSFPKTGSTGDGQDFARALGLRVEPCRAGLTGLEARLPPGFRAGQRFERAWGRVTAGGATLYAWEGEVEVERWGFSGAAVYNCQRYLARTGRRDAQVELETPAGRVALAHPTARPLKEAIVTIGGVARDEIDPATMMARRIPGLFFAGEVLDVDGPTGGYNLSIAFATARCAVLAVAGR